MQRGDFLPGIATREAFFLIREHGNLLWEAVPPEESKERAENSRLYEHPIVAEASRGEGSAETQGPQLRRVRLALDKPTQGRETKIVMLTNASVSYASAGQVALLGIGASRRDASTPLRTTSRLGKLGKITVRQESESGRIMPRSVQPRPQRGPAVPPPPDLAPTRRPRR